MGWQLPDGSLERPIASKRLSPFIEALGRSVFLRAIELNGPAATVEGNSWEGTSATGQLPANFSFDGWTQSRAATATLIPAVSDGAKAFVLRNTIAKHGAKDRLSIQVGGLAQGHYQVYLYIYEPTVTPKEYALLVEGLGPGGKPLGQEGKYRTGAQHSWVRIGPVRAQVLDGAATIEVVSTDFVYVGGVEVHRELQGVPPPTVVRAGADFTLPGYASGFTLRGGAERILSRNTGYKVYELQDHLGNVRVVVGDGRQGQLQAEGSLLVGGDGNLFVRAAVRSYAHYYPFGMAEPGGSFQAQGAGSYRYGYNGKELDKEGLGGGGSTYDYGFRIYNPAIAKFLSVDPLTKNYPWYTPYQFAGNKPIENIDLDGAEEYNYSLLLRFMPAPAALGTTPGTLPTIYRLSPVDHPGYYRWLLNRPSDKDGWNPPKGPLTIGPPNHLDVVAASKADPMTKNLIKARAALVRRGYINVNTQVLQAAEEIQDEPQPGTEYFYRAMSWKEFGKTAGLLEGKTDERTGELRGDSPFITGDLKYLTNRNSYIWKQRDKYDIIVRYTVMPTTTNYLNSPSNSRPYVEGLSVQAIIQAGKLVRKPEAYTTAYGEVKNTNYGFPGNLGDLHFNNKVIKINIVSMDTPGLKGQ